MDNEQLDTGRGLPGPGWDSAEFRLRGGSRVKWGQVKASDKIRERIENFLASSQAAQDINQGRISELLWALELVEAQERDTWTLCTVTPVPRTVVSETRPAWIEVWQVAEAHTRNPITRPSHLEPIGPFNGNEWRYNSWHHLWRVVAWRYVVPPEAAGANP